jgi:hypothetical protein
MTLDDLIETLHALRARYPSAGSAQCSVDLDEVSYEQGVVQLGLRFVLDEDDDDEDDDDEDDEEEDAVVH